MTRRIRQATGRVVAFDTVIVPAAATLLLPANPRRLRVLIQNYHTTQNIYVGSDNTVSNVKGLIVPIQHYSNWGCLELFCTTAIWVFGYGQHVTYWEESY